MSHGHWLEGRLGCEEKIPGVKTRATVPFQERPTCTVAEACAAAGIGMTKLYELIGSGAIESVTIGRRRLIRVDSLLRLLAVGD
jgi:excisionase family DNA binding protein